MNILLTGATGFVGGKTFDVLKGKNDVDITVLSRVFSAKFLSQKLMSDFNGDSDFSDALNDIDVIIHCAARVHVMDEKSIEPLHFYREVNVEGTLNLARQAIMSGVKRFIFISTVKVNGEDTNLNEPFRAGDDRRPEDYYGQSKAEAEERLLLIGKETGLEIVIIRPTLVYGPGVKANFASLMNLVSKGIPLPFGCIKNNKRSLASVDNLVDLIVTCIDHPKAANQVFLISDDHDVSTSEMVREMARSLNKPQWQLPIPKWCYRLAGSIFGKKDVVDRLLGSLQVDITHTKETLDWKPPQTLEEGFKETAEAFLLNKENKK